MKIDFSLPTESRYMLYLDANMRWGSRHVKAAFSEAPIPLFERVYHFAIGLIMIIPVIGHLIAAAEYVLCGRTSKIKLKETDPFRRGFEFGSRLKSETQFVYECARRKIEQRVASNPNAFNRALEQLKRSIPDHLHEEMRGLSAGAGVTLDDVYKLHTFLDIYAGEYGCSALASINEGGDVRRIARTNHFGDAQWCLRLNALKSAPLENGAEAHQKALGKANVEDTIQSVVFDVNRKEVHFTSAWARAAEKIFSLFSFFKGKKEPGEGKRIFAAFNLDWPWTALSPYAMLVSFKSQDGKKKFVNLTFPGYLGVLRGMNEEGVVVGCCQAGSSKQDDGMPVTMIFRDLLENTSTAAEAERRLATLRPASSMNLVVAGKDGAFSAELDPSRSAVGIVAVRRI